MSLHTWSRVNQHISHKSSGPFQRYKHNITFLTAEVFINFSFVQEKGNIFIPWQVPNSYIGKKNLYRRWPTGSLLNVFLFFSFYFFFFFLLIQYHGDNSDQTMHLLWFIQYIFSSLMKHKTENTHKTHYKAAVRLQWRDSMAQHGRLVVSCTGTLHTLPTQWTTSALCVRTQEVVGALMWISSTWGQG